VSPAAPERPGSTSTRDADSARLRVGVGVCALNEERAIARLVERLFGRLLGPASVGAHEAGASVDRDDLADHIVVADGGSRDGTCERATALGATVVTAARGRGVQLAAAADALLASPVPFDVLVFLHADSVPEAGALCALREAFRGGLQAAGFRQHIESNTRSLRLVARAADARVRRGMVYGDSGLAVTPAAYRRAGGFPPWPLFEDVGLSKALRRAGARPVLLEGALLHTSARRWRDEGFLRCTLRNWMLRGLFEVGVTPARLARLYRPHVKP